MTPEASNQINPIHETFLGKTDLVFSTNSDKKEIKIDLSGIKLWAESYFRQ